MQGDRRGLNPRQPEPQSGALPTELRPHEPPTRWAKARRELTRASGRRKPFFGASPATGAWAGALAQAYRARAAALDSVRVLWFTRRHSSRVITPSDAASARTFLTSLTLISKRPRTSRARSVDSLRRTMRVSIRSRACSTRSSTLWEYSAAGIGKRPCRAEAPATDAVVMSANTEPMHNPRNNIPSGTSTSPRKRRAS